MSAQQALVRELKDNQYVMCIVPLDDFVKECQNRKDTLKTMSGWTSPIMDAVTAGKLLQELGASPGNAVIKSHQGKKYLIFKGYAGQREIFKGTRYLTTNPLVVRMAVGPTGIKNAARGGFVLTALLAVSIEIFDFFLSDRALLSELLGTISSDIIKIGISSITAATIALKIGSAAVIGGAATPVIAAIVVGIATGWVLTKLDEKYGVTQALIVAYKNIGIDLANLKYQVERELKSVPSSSQSLRCYFMPCMNFTH